jgi:hypothetical protein
LNSCFIENQSIKFFQQLCSSSNILAWSAVGVGDPLP